jgi:hypothetical protein
MTPHGEAEENEERCHDDGHPSAVAEFLENSNRENACAHHQRETVNEDVIAPLRIAAPRPPESPHAELREREGQEHVD